MKLDHTNDHILLFSSYTKGSANWINFHLLPDPFWWDVSQRHPLDKEFTIFYATLGLTLNKCFFLCVLSELLCVNTFEWLIAATEKALNKPYIQEVHFIKGKNDYCQVTGDLQYFWVWQYPLYLYNQFMSAHPPVMIKVKVRKWMTLCIAHLMCFNSLLIRMWSLGVSCLSIHTHTSCTQLISKGSWRK